MKKKRPQQQVTPLIKGLNILSVKRSAFPVEPPQEQSAAVSMEKPETDATPAPEPAIPTPLGAVLDVREELRISGKASFHVVVIPKLKHFTTRLNVPNIF